jgi:5-methylcytosine-specific restriction endonuclease McrA
MDRKEYMRAYYKANQQKWKRTPECAEKRNAARRAKYAADAALREKVRSGVMEWQRANPDKRKAQRLKPYGITHAEFTAMLAAQNGRCAICGHSDLSVPNLFPLVDHCHKTGKVRGLLCMNCNQAIGKMGDDPERLRRAALYLENRG